MAKIRDDFEGVTFVRTADGDVVLKAGDKIPKGVVVGDHLLAVKASAVESENTGQTDGEDTEAANGDTETESEDTGDGSEDTDEENDDESEDDESDEDEVESETTGQTESLAIPPRAGAGSSQEAWRAYAIAATSARGLNIDLPDDTTRADIIAALDGAGIPTE